MTDKSDHAPLLDRTDPPDPTTQRETRARRRIRQAVESRGFKLLTLEWEPWSDGGEKSGICGGWYGTVDRQTHPSFFPGNEVMGLSVEEAVAWVDEFFPTPEPCACKKPDYPRPSQAHEPTFMHEPECRWRLNYWLAWWGPKEANRA